jgi:L-2-hydroxycarboxylate dehydrogenase (NAD+)
MKPPPADAVRVSADALRDFVRAVAERVSIPAEQAGVLSRLLIASDLRGVASHGSVQMLRYAREIRGGGINPLPTLQTVREGPTSLLLDGDFGLGYFPMLHATERAIDKAREHGVAVVATRHHGHIGAAGLYARMTLEHDLCTFVTSGVQLHLAPDKGVIAAAGGSPMAFSAPGHDEPPLVLDCGVTHDMQGSAREFPGLCDLAPGVVLRAIGFGTVCQVWGGLLTGIPADPARAPQQYPDANQGALLITFRIGLFAEPEQFKREIDEYARRVRTLQPIPGTEGAFLPGGVEAEREKQYLRDGIPLGASHRNRLETLAGMVNIRVPW